MADTRKYDRQEVGKMRDNATTTRDRQRAEQVLHKINNESKRVNQLRGNLIQAVRHGDVRAIKYYDNKLRNEK